MKKNSIVKVVLITILVLMLFTWILPAAYFSSEFIDQGRVQMGLFDLFNYPVTALSYFGYVAMFVLVVGGFYGILYKIPAYRNFLNRIANKLKGNGALALSITMIVIAIITSFCGIQIALAIFIPLIISVILLMGYDKVVAALVIVGSTMIGLAGTTYAYANVNVLNSALGLEISSELLSKIIILVVGLVLLIFNTMLYIKKGKTVKKKAVDKVKDMKRTTKVVETKKAGAKKPAAKKTTSSNKKTSTKKGTGKKPTKGASKSSRNHIKAAVKEDKMIIVKDKLEEDSFVPADVSAKKLAIWPFVVGFILLFVVLIMSFVSWADAFKLEAFKNATTSVSEFKLFGFPLFGKLLGSVNAFGSWNVVDMIVVMFVVTLVLVIIYRVKFDDVLEGFRKGIKRALPIAVIIILIYTCLVITTYHPFQLTIYKAFLGAGKSMGVGRVFTTSLTAILAAVFNVEPLYAFQSVVPYLASLTAEKYSVIAVIYQSVYGVTMLVAPTSVVLMSVLSYLNISFKEWFKVVWKLLVELFVVLLIIFIILVLI